MIQIILAILLIAIIVLLINWLIYLVAVAFFTLPAWGGALVLMFRIRYLHRERMMQAAFRPENLSRLMSPSIQSGTISWHVEESGIEWYTQKAQAGDVALGSFLIALAIDVSVMIGLYYCWPVFERANTLINWLLAEPASRGTAFVWGLIISAVIVIVTAISSALCTKPDHAFADSLRQRFKKHIDTIDVVMLDEGEELDRLENRNKNLYTAFAVHYEPCLQSRVEDYIAQNAIAVISNPGTLHVAVAAMIDDAKQTASNLEGLLKLYNVAKDLHSRLAQKAVRSSSHTVITGLDGIYECLESENFAYHLERRNWHICEQMITAVIEGLRQIEAGEPWFEEEAEEEGVCEDKDERWACGVLNIPVTAPLEHIEKAYRALVLAWHPDQSDQKADRFIEIQKAYEMLKEKRSRS